MEIVDRRKIAEGHVRTRERAGAHFRRELRNAARRLKFFPSDVVTYVSVSLFCISYAPTTGGLGSHESQKRGHVVPILFNTSHGSLSLGC